MKIILLKLRPSNSFLCTRFGLISRFEFVRSFKPKTNIHMLYNGFTCLQACKKIHLPKSTSNHNEIISNKISFNSNIKLINFLRLKKN